jgi:pyruvate formate lyase activating enzyme
MNDGLPPIKGFLPTTLIEWEGRVSCCIFLPCCNFRCPFCHARDLVLPGMDLDAIPFSSVVGHLEANRGWIDGLVVSGGEPTLQPRLASLIQELRRHVPAIKLDTNGSSPDVVAALLDDGLVDAVAMDVKAPLGEAYSKAAGVAVDCSAIRATIDLLCSRGVAREFRTTVVPGLHTRGDIVAIARQLGSTEALVLQQFAPLNCIDPLFLERRPFPREELREMASAASEFVAECRVRGEPSARGAKA